VLDSALLRPGIYLSICLSICLYYIYIYIHIYSVYTFTYI